jgi:hypothetical protein
LPFHTRTTQSEGKLWRVNYFGDMERFWNLINQAPSFKIPAHPDLYYKKYGVLTLASLKTACNICF